MSRYEDYRKNWESRVRSRQGRLLGPRRVRANAFKAELNRLVSETGDARFRDASRALEDLDLINADGSWCRSSSVNDVEGVVLMGGRDYLVEQIKYELVRGKSLREACARIVDDWDEVGQSFDASVKRIERAYRKELARAGSGLDPDGTNPEVGRE